MSGLGEHMHACINQYIYLLLISFSLGEGFSHVAAMIEAANRNGYTATTSSTCRWNEVFTTKV